MQHYSGGRPYGVRLRKPPVVKLIQEKEKPYSQLTKEGNEPFPVTGVIKIKKTKGNKRWVNLAFYCLYFRKWRQYERKY